MRSLSQRSIASRVPPSSIRIGDRDTETGKDAVFYPDGGSQIAGKRLFNASLPYGSEVGASQPQTSSIIALDRNFPRTNELYKGEKLMER